MDIQAAKLQFIEEYLRLKDERIITRLSEVLEEEKVKTKRVVLSKGEKQALKKGLEDINAGRTHTHEEVMEEMRKKYPTIVK